MTSSLSRRGFITATGALSIGGVLAACSGSGPSGGSGAGGGGIQWWDHFGGFQKLHKEWAGTETTKIGTDVSYTYHQVSAAAEALQLAKQANQLPDVYSNVLGLPLSALVEAGWLAEITLSATARKALPPDAFVEGVSMIGGKIYGMPFLTDRQYWCCTWFNEKLRQRAGFEPPTSYDSMLAALKSVADLGDSSIFPMTLPLGDAGRIRDQVNDLAQYGGFPGLAGQRFDTGAFNWDHDGYVNAIELLKEINAKKYLMPGSNQYKVPDARTQYASGRVGLTFDGPWAPGGVRNILASFVDTMGTSGILTPDGGPRVGYRGAPDPVWFVAGNSKNPKVAAQLLESFTTDDYLLKMSAAMDQPPLNLDVVDKAQVTDAYKYLVADFKKVVFRAPQAVVRKPEVSKALGNYKDINPHLGSIIQGYLAGQVKDLPSALRDLNGRFESMVDAAVKKAKDGGANVSREDWAFDDWKPGQDYKY